MKVTWFQPIRSQYWLISNSIFGDYKPGEPGTTINHQNGYVCLSDHVTELRLAQEKIKELDTVCVSQKIEVGNYFIFVLSKLWILKKLTAVCEPHCLNMFG